MSGGANNSRLTTITYPNARQVGYNYASGVDNTISRLTSMTDGATTLESYAYLGLGTVVKRAHPEPGVDLTYIKQTGEGTGDAGDQYTGLDRFGRVADQRWRKTSDGSHTDRFGYGYDRDGNRLYRDNTLSADPPAASNGYDELYHANGASAGYDSRNQLTDFRRGPLSDTNTDNIPDTVSTASATAGWTYDEQGNMTSVSVNGTPTSRTHDAQNELKTVGGATLTYDNAGNMTKDEAAQTYRYDAWNREVEVKDSGGTTLGGYGYDGLNRRVT